MALSMPLADRQTRLNSVSPRMAKAQTSSNSPANPLETAEAADLLSLVEQARRRAGLKLEYLTDLSGLKSKGQLSAALSGQGNFNIAWLNTWPEEFWHEFMPLLRASREVSPEAHRRLVIQQLGVAIDRLLALIEAVA